MVFGRGSKEPSTTEAEPVEAPCVPCKAAAEAQQFSLNAPAAPAITDAAVPAVAAGVTTDVGDDGVDLRVEGRERTYRLNATAGLIWLTIDGRLDLAGITADLAAETGAPADQIAPDVRSSVATFADQGLVTVS